MVTAADCKSVSSGNGVRFPGHPPQNEIKMFKVYWTKSDGSASSKDFEDMTEALNYTQWLRSVDNKFVTMCSELENMVGNFGVKEVGEGYSWKKRRI